MLTKADIQLKLSLVAKHQLDMWDFHRWLEDESWNMHKDSSASAMGLVGDIKLAFEEYYQGRMDERALFECLMGIPIIYVRPVSAGAKIELMSYWSMQPAGAQPQLLFS